MVGLPDGEKKTLRICVTVYAQYRRMTDRQTDGQTDRHIATHSPRYAYASSSFLLSSLFGVSHAPFASQCCGLSHRLAQCATPGKGLV